MSKQRFKTVATSALTSKKLAQLDATSERLFWRIHFASDAFGTMSGDPWDVLQLAVPSVKGFDMEAVELGIDTLVGVRLLERWQEADEAWWIHILDHDRHQSGYFRSKRGKRMSPIPPSQRKARSGPEPRGATRSEPESSAPDAELSPSLPCATPIVAVAVAVEDAGEGADRPTATSGVVTPIGALKNDAASVEAADPLKTLSADVIKATRSRIEAELAKVLVDDGDASTLAFQIVSQKHRQAFRVPGTQQRKVYDLPTWERAVGVAVRQIEGGKEVRGDLAGFIIGLLPSYEQPGSERIIAVRPAKSASPDTGSGDWDHLEAEVPA